MTSTTVVVALRMTVKEMECPMSNVSARLSLPVPPMTRAAQTHAHDSAADAGRGQGEVCWRSCHECMFDGKPCELELLLAYACTLLKSGSGASQLRCQCMLKQHRCHSLHPPQHCMILGRESKLILQQCLKTWQNSFHMLHQTYSMPAYAARVHGSMHVRSHFDSF